MNNKTKTYLGKKVWNGTKWVLLHPYLNLTLVLLGGIILGVSIARLWGS